jgi:hypothetical protein
MTRQEPPAEVQRKLPHDPKLWARNYLRHPNDPSRPYDFYDDTKQNFLWYLADEDSPMNPENWGDINVLLFARGCLKTWSVTTILAWALDMYPSLEALATAPVDDQRGEVIDRFKQKVEQSGMVERRTKDNVSHQKFKNKSIDPETGEVYTAYSHLKSRSAWNEGDKLRGIHAHIGVIDEAQDVDEGTFSTFLEAIDREVPQVDYFPTVFVIGTPKMANTFFHRLWRYSDQKTWDADEREWIQQADAQKFLPEELEQERKDLKEQIQTLKEERELARQRGNTSRAKELSGLIEEFRDELDEIEGFTVRGWHIDQHNSPLHNRKNVAFKRETYSKQRFENEVNANFFSPENDLIVNDDVWQVGFVEGEGFKPEPQFDNTLTVLSVDWGGGSGEGAAKTVIMVGEMDPDGETLRVLNIDVLDSDLSSREEREQIARYMERYDVDIGVVDEGYGDTDREELQDELGFSDKDEQTIYGCWYGNVKEREEIKWNRHHEQKRFFTASKTFMVKKMAEDFKTGKIKIPKANLSFDGRHSLGTQVVEQLTAPYTEKKETRAGRTKVEVVSDRQDDIFDALTYLWIAAHKVKSRRTLKQLGSTKRPGY